MGTPPGTKDGGRGGRAPERRLRVIGEGRADEAGVLRGWRHNMAFFQRVISYIANEVLVEGLANSRTFQRFAVMTNEMFKEGSKTGARGMWVLAAAPRGPHPANALTPPPPPFPPPSQAASARAQYGAQMETMASELKRSVEKAAAEAAEEAARQKRAPK